MQIDPDLLRQCWFLAGPTACGKTAASLALAQHLNAEIISMDSMAIYRGMDIGTAKPPQDTQQQVPHHLIDVVHPDEEFSVSQFVEAAAAVVGDIVARGRVPLFVGGTGLYLRGVLRGVFEGPAADWDYRRKLQEAADREGGDWLHQELAKVDPATAELRHPNDHRRLIRALEVFHVTGKRLSEHQQQQPLPEPERPSHVYWLSGPRAWLHDRIATRVDTMVDDGLVEETRGLLASEHPPGRTAAQALGYAEVIGYLQGHADLAETVEAIKTHTRQFAKRQHTWFRNLVECRAIDLEGDETAEAIVDRLFN